MFPGYKVYIKVEATSIAGYEYFVLQVWQAQRSCTFVHMTKDEAEKAIELLGRCLPESHIRKSEEQNIINLLMPYIIGFVEPPEERGDLCNVVDGLMTIEEFKKKWLDDVADKER